MERRASRPPERVLAAVDIARKKKIRIRVRAFRRTASQHNELRLQAPRTEKRKTLLLRQLLDFFLQPRIPPEHRDQVRHVNQPSRRIRCV
jgi:hypothetical protein